jgi:hypothetical protein
MVIPGFSSVIAQFHFVGSLSNAFRTSTTSVDCNSFNLQPTQLLAEETNISEDDGSLFFCFCTLLCKILFYAQYNDELTTHIVFLIWIDLQF